jgi:hypothetical protein
MCLNAALRAFRGVRRDDLPRFDWSRTIHPDDIEALFERFGRVMAARASFGVEARCCAPTASTVWCAHGVECG